MGYRSFGFGLMLLALLPAGAVGQAPSKTGYPVWDTPSFMAPGREDALGIYLIKPRDTDFGIAGTWRTGGPLNLGVRGDYIQITEGLSQWGIGADAKGGLGEFAAPIAVNWTLGIGATSGAGATLLRVPLGLTLGAHLVSPGLRLTPYVHPRVSFVYTSFDRQFQGEPRESDSTFEFDTDLGADLDLGQIIIRVGGTIGDQPAFGAGLAFKLRRAF